jgi:prephenate dehydrogenase
MRRSILFVDVLSVKEFPRKLVLQILLEEFDLLCTHPMFGPESMKDGWKGMRKRELGMESAIDSVEEENLVFFR